jgi:hypothetical protein
MPAVRQALRSSRVAPSLCALPGRLLQRTCACGGTAGLAGRCKRRGRVHSMQWQLTDRASFSATSTTEISPHRW